MSDDCGHTFCEVCITNWKQKKNECPTCRSEITIVKNKWMETNIINQLKYNCLDCNYICDVGDKCSGIIAHNSKCEFKLVKCVCGFESLHEELVKHKIESCQEESITCNLCSSMVKRKSMKNHLVNNVGSGQYCESFIQCFFGCKEIMKISDMFDHKSKCLSRLINCEVCNKEIKFKNKCLHIETAECLKVKNGKMQNTIIELNNRINFLEDTVNKLKKKVLDKDPYHIFNDIDYEFKKYSQKTNIDNISLVLNLDSDDDINDDE
jgi:hypothetical protein